MKHVKQGLNECLLASFAMLADIDIELARTVAKNVFYRLKPDGWYTDWYSSLNYFDGIEGMVEYLTEISKEMNIQFLDKPTVRTCEQAKASTGINEREPDLSGRGQISISLGFSGGHSMAYENGLIYDPHGKFPEGETWKHFKKRHHCYIYKVRVVPVKKNE